MKILWLGPTGKIGDIIRKGECTVVRRNEAVDIKFVRNERFDCAVSYRYRHIVRSDVIQYFKERIINLHISLLPWNRGADPNLWSFLENTPKGVTIHWMDCGIDTGDILAQKEISFEPEDTLASTYTQLETEILSLFELWWPIFIQGKARRYTQPPGGSFHKLKDKEPFLSLLTEGWNTRVAQINGKALGGGKVGSF